MVVPTETTPWPYSKYRRGSVNSFGYGGANSHVIIDAAESFLPGYNSIRFIKQNHATSGKANSVNWKGSGTTYENGHGPEHKQVLPRQYLLVVSAHDQVNLSKNITSVLQAGSKYEIHDLCFTLGAKRSHHVHRAFSLVDGTSEDGVLNENVLTIEKRPKANPTVAFVFTGMESRSR